MARIAASKHPATLHSVKGGIYLRKSEPPRPSKNCIAGRGLSSETTGKSLVPDMLSRDQAIARFAAIIALVMACGCPIAATMANDKAHHLRGSKAEHAERDLGHGWGWDNGYGHSS